MLLELWMLPCFHLDDNCLMWGIGLCKDSLVSSRAKEEPQNLVVIIHLHGMEGVLSCLLELWHLSKLPHPHSPQEKHG